MMESFSKDYLSAKRKKRMFTEMLANRENTLETEKSKRTKISKREQLKELKLIQYFENLLLITDKTIDWEMEKPFPLVESINNYKEITDDILIENTIEKDQNGIFLWDQEKFNTFLHYEKLVLKLFDFSKIISNERIILKEDLDKIQNRILLSFLIYLNNYSISSDSMVCEFEGNYRKTLTEIEYCMSLD